MRLYIFRGCGTNGSGELRGVMVVSANNVENAISMLKSEIKDTPVDAEISVSPAKSNQIIWYLKDELSSPTEESKIVFSDYFFVS